MNHPKSDTHKGCM